MIALFLRAKFEFVTSFFGIHTRYNQFNYLWCIDIALKNIAFKANGSVDIIDYNFSSFKHIVRKIAQDLPSIINRKSNSVWMITTQMSVLTNFLKASGRALHNLLTVSMTISWDLFSFSRLSNSVTSNLQISHSNGLACKRNQSKFSHKYAVHVFKHWGKAYIHLFVQ